MATHPIAYEELIAFAQGDLSMARLTDVEAHISGCQDCASSVLVYRLVRGTVQSDAQAAPSPEVLARIKRLTATTTVQPERESLLDTARRIAARLAFDGRQPGAAAGLRGSPAAYALIYTIDDIDIDLQIERLAPNQDRWLITGQVALPANARTVELTLVSAGEQTAVADASSDETGMFTIEAPAGTYDLFVIVGDETIVAPGVSVG